MTSLTVNDAAAEQVVELLPTLNRLHAQLRTSTQPLVAEVRAAVTATFVGSPSRDVAIALAHADGLISATDTGTAVSVADLLAPALAAATAVYGVGVTGEAKLSDAAGLFADATTVVYELRDGQTVAGWFAVRVRENGAVSGISALTDRSVAARLFRINDVEMALTVVIGRTRMPVRDVLGLEPGAVIELDRSAGAPADILLNGRLIAVGEVVVVDQDYAVRVTRILEVQDGSS